MRNTWKTKGCLLVSAISLAPLLFGLANAQTVTAAKAEILAGGLLELTWTHPPTDGMAQPNWGLCIIPITTEQMNADTLPPLRSCSVEDYKDTKDGRSVYSFPGWSIGPYPYRHYAAVVVDDQFFKSVPFDKFVFTVRHPVIPYQSGLIQLPEGRKFSANQDIPIEITATNDSVSAIQTGEDLRSQPMGIDRHVIGVYRLPVELENGVISVGGYVGHFGVRSQTMSINFLKDLMSKHHIVRRGAYELHYIFDRWVLDRQRIEIEGITSERPGAFQIKKVESTKLIVQADRKIFESLIDEGHEDGPRYILFRLFEKTKSQIAAAPVTVGYSDQVIDHDFATGTYRLQMVVGGEVVMTEEFTFSAEGLASTETKNASPGPLAVDIGPAFSDGSSVHIKAAGQLQGGEFDEKRELVLYRGKSFQIDRGSTKPERRWPLHAGEIVEQEILLPAGFYVASIEGLKPGEFNEGRRWPLFEEEIEVELALLPGQIRVDLDEGIIFAPGEQISAKMSMDDISGDLASQDRFFVVLEDPNLTYPVCVRNAFGNAHGKSHIRVNGDHSFSLYAPQMPGSYVLRTYYRPKGSTRAHEGAYHLGGEQIIRVAIPEAKVQLTSADPLEANTRPYATIVRGERLSGEVPAGFDFSFAMDGYVAPGGALRYPAPLLRKSDFGSGRFRENSQLEQPVKGKPYDIAATVRATVYYRGFLLDSAPFTTVDLFDPDIPSFLIQKLGEAPRHDSPTVPYQPLVPPDLPVVCPGFNAPVPVYSGEPASPPAPDLSSDEDWPDYPHWVIDKGQFVRDLLLLEPNREPKKGENYWSDILPDSMGKKYGINHVFLVVSGPDILRGAIEVIEDNPRLVYEIVYRGKYGDPIWYNDFDDFKNVIEAAWNDPLSMAPQEDNRYIEDVKDDEVLLISVELKEGASAGLHSFELLSNDGQNIDLPPAQWMLPNSINPATISFARNTRQGEYDDINEVFIHDRIFLKIKADYPVAADEISVDISINGKAVEITGRDDSVIKLYRVPGSERDFISNTLGLISPTSQSNNSTANTIYIKAEPGKQISAHVHPYSPVAARSAASAKIHVTPANVDSLWLDALVDAARSADLDITKYDIATTSGRFKLADNDFIVSSPHRNIGIKLGDIAAMLLMKKHFVSSMKLMHERMLLVREEARKDPWISAGFRESVRDIARNSGSPFGSIPVVAHEGIGLNLHVDFYNVYDEKYLYDRFKGNSYDERTWQHEATLSVIDSYIEAIEESLILAEGIEDTDWVELLELTGVHFGPIQNRILPNLLRLAEDTSGQTLAWEVDKIARGYLLKVASLGQELVHNGEVREAQRSVVLAAASLTIAAPETIIFKVLSFSVNAMVLIDATTVGVIDYLDRKREAGFAFGAIEVLGFRRFEYAKQREVSAAMLAINLVGSVAGVAGDSFKLYELAKIRMTLKEIPHYTQILDSLADAERMSEAQKESLALMVGEVKFIDSKLKDAGNKFLLTPPELKLHQEMKSAVDQLMPRMNTLKQAKTSYISRELLNEIRPVARPPDLVSPELPNGGSIDGLKIENRLGSGSSAAVYSLTDYEDEVIKMLNTDRSYDVLVRTERTLELLEDTDIPHLKVKRLVAQSNSPDGYAYLVQERLPKGAVMYNYGRREFRITLGHGERRRTVIREVQFGIEQFDGGVLPRNRQRALLRLVKKLGEKGLAMEDSHLGNFYFQRIDGRWEAGILDFDRIVPFSENFTPLLSESESLMFKGFQDSAGMNTDWYRNAIWSMEETALPPGASEVLESGQHIYPNADLFMEKALEYKWMIRYDRESGTWLDSVLEMDVVEEFFPDIRKHVDMTMH